MRREFLARRIIAVAAATTLLAGCAGPRAKLSFGGKAVPIDVAFGSPKKGEPGAVTGPSILQSGPGGIGVVPVPLGRNGTQATTRSDGPPPPQPQGACAAADPFKFPLAAVDTQVRTTAPMGEFPYRVMAHASQGGETREFVGRISERVSNAVANSDGSFSYSVESQGPNGVVVRQQFSAQPATDTLPGLVGLLGEENVVGSQTYSFSSPKALKLLPLRASTGASWDDVAHDPTSATTITVQGQIVGTDRINACGQPVDAFKVSTTEDVVTPNEHVTLTMTRWFATQYGGLVVAESYSYHGTVTAGNTTVDGDYSAIINRDPSVTA